MAENERRRGMLAACLCLALLLGGAAYYVFDIGVPSPLLPYRDATPGGVLPSGPRVAEASPESNSDNLNLLARVISGEAEDEPYAGKVGVGAVLLNRMQSSAFPHTLAGVVFQPDAFESVTNGAIWWRQPSMDDIKAGAAALSGWDPTYGALYFWNPSKPVNPWVWTRQILTQIGQQVFAR